MYSFIFFSVSAICFFGGLISAVMAITGGASDSFEHWKNAAIYGAIAPASMFAAIYIFWNSKTGLESLRTDRFGSIASVNADVELNRIAIAAFPPFWLHQCVSSHRWSVSQPQAAANPHAS